MISDDLGYGAVTFTMHMARCGRLTPYVAFGGRPFDWPCVVMRGACSEPARVSKHWLVISAWPPPLIPMH